jgi:hypothetical protein
MKRRGSLAVVVALLAPPVRADESSCRTAYVETQRWQRGGELRAARRAALVCGQDECSPTVRASCVDWLGQIERALPTIVVDARDSGDAALSAVRVEADGELLAERLTGRAIELDPGESVLRFTFGDRWLEQRTLIHEGEKYRAVTVRFEEPALTPPLAASSLDAPPPNTRTTATPVPTAAYVLSGLGVAGLGAFAVLGATTYAAEDDLRDRCGRSCSTRAVGALRSRYLLADAALGVGVTSLLALSVIWLWPGARVEAPAARDHGSTPRASTRLRLGPGAIDLTGEF